MKNRRISEAVIRRLPRYYRQLEMLVSHEIERISSSELAAQMGLNASQVRQDLNCFGGFGQQGYGYHVATLYKEIANILGLSRPHSVIIAGAGNIGQALTNYEGFGPQGFHVRALFDVDEALIGKTISGIPVYHIDEMPAFIKKEKIEIGVIAARRRVAQSIADTMVQAGIQGIWNFVPITVTAEVPVENVHLSDSMYVLSYRLNTRDED